MRLTQLLTEHETHLRWWDLFHQLYGNIHSLLILVSQTGFFFLFCYITQFSHIAHAIVFHNFFITPTWLRAADEWWRLGQVVGIATTAMQKVAPGWNETVVSSLRSHDLRGLCLAKQTVSMWTASGFTGIKTYFLRSVWLRHWTRDSLF